VSATAFHGTFSENVGTSYVALTFTEVYDSHGWHDDSVDPTRMVVPMTGWYLIHFVGGGAAGAKPSARFKIDGGTTYAVNGQSTNGGNIKTEALHVMRLQGKQYIEVELIDTSSTHAASGSVSITRLPTPLFVGKSASGSSGVANLIETYDPAGWHDESTNTSRVTVDATGTYLVMAQGTSNNQEVTYDILSNGASIHTGKNTLNTNAGSVYGGPTYISIHSLAAGDYLEISSSNGAEITTFAVARVDNVRLAMAKQTTGTTVPAYGSQPKIVDFDSEEIDTDAFHDNATNNSRVTIPTGEDGVYMAFMNIALATTNVLQMLLNGAATWTTERNGATSIGATNTRLTHGCVSAIDSYSAGDYFQCHMYAVPGNATNTGGTFLGVICLDDLVYETNFVPQIIRRR